MKLEIKKVSSKDIEDLIEIWEKSGYRLSTQEKMRDIIEKSIKESEVFIVISNNKKVGYIILTKKDNCTYLNMMQVIKSERGKGIGGEIIKYCIKKSKNNKSEKLELKVYAKNFSAIGLYNKFGFYVKGLTDEFDKELGRKIEMEKIIR